MADHSPADSSISSGRSVKHSRNGCVTCKDRRRRCTEEKPACARCIADGRVCKYTLRLIWEDESRKRGVKHGRGSQRSVQSFDPTPIDIVTTKAGSKDTRDGDIYFLNTFNSDVEARPARHLIPLRQRSRTTHTLRPQYGLNVHGLNSMSGSLFQYYQLQMCYNLTLVDDSSNGFRHIVLPIAHSHRLVMDTVLAVGALHLSLEQPSDSVDFYAIALHHRQKVLRRLRDELSSVHGSSSDHILVSMLMLCLFDITDSCQNSWPTHLKAASDLLRIGSTASRNPLLAAFVSRFFATRHVMSRSACGAKSKFEGFTSASPQEIDKSWGCSFELMTIISSITDLSRRNATGYFTDLDDIKSRTFDLETRLTELNQIMPPLSSSTHISEQTLLSQTAALIQNATNIYLYTALHSAIPSTHLVQTLVRSQMSPLLILPCLRSTHLWSIFVTALYANNDEERLFFLHQFERLEAVRPVIGPAVTARCIIETVWKRRDLDADKCLQESRSETADVGVSDWERYVRPLCEGLSLV